MKKIYLNTVEEITKALNEGKTLIDDYNNTYKKINSMLVCFLRSGAYINGDILCIDQRKYYYEEKEPIKLEVGKFYKTRDDYKAICVAYIPKKREKLNYMMYIIGDKDGMPFFANENGLTGDKKQKSPFDIVDYWKD